MSDRYNFGIRMVSDDDKDSSTYESSFQKTDDLFEKLYNEGEVTINGIKLINRDGQSLFALSIMEAIKNKEIILINAGTGIGKSIGYLIPIFNTINNVEKFNHVIISTSTLALQQQLLTSINNVSQMLEINITTSIAKGMNNYLCIKRLEYLLLHREKLSNEEFDTLTLLKSVSRELKTADRIELNNFSNQIWEKVKLYNRGVCSNCSYSKNCYYLTHEEEMKNANIVVTNHSNLAYQLGRKNNAITSSDMVVIDEAHKLPEALNTVNGDNFTVDDIIFNINAFGLNIEDTRYLIVSLRNMFRSIKDNAIGISLKTDKIISKNDVVRYSFNIFNEVKDNIVRVDKLLKNFLGYLNSTGLSKKDYYEKNIEYLEKYSYLFTDMLRGNNKSNIYWVTFNYNNSVSIAYVSKDNANILKDLFKSNIPILLTSGTLLDATGDYKYFMKEIGIDKKDLKRKISTEWPIESPYDFETNSLIYYNPDLPDPSELKNKKYDYFNYITSLANEINKLIITTNGRSLILFTSKKDMENIYKILSSFEYPFELLIQKDNNVDKIKDEFSEKTDSCLLATGTFWEGVDIQGDSLSNLIITHLPFSVPEPVIEYRASKEPENERFEKVYLNDMLQKISQGMGRLIRSNTDTGIICVLDPRFSKYIENVKNVTPFKNFTTSITDVESFVDEKINKKR